MAYFSSKIVSILISLFALLSLIMNVFAAPTLSLDDELQPNAPVVPHQTDYNYQGFQIKKTAPVFLNSRHNKNEKGHIYRNRSTRKRWTTKNLDARRFSAMLPKGYVPPSGSSPCHNVYPNSVTFFCDLSTGTRKP